MSKKSAFLILALMPACMLTLAFNICRVGAEGVIYIRADGSIDPPTAPITTSDNITYALTDDVTGLFVIERDNIVFDGEEHVVKPVYLQYAITLSGRSNVTIKNTIIEDVYFGFALLLNYSNNNIIAGNTFQTLVRLDSSSANKITENIITRHKGKINLFGSSTHNVIAGNNITGCAGPIALEASSNSNSIVGNSLISCARGIYISSDNNTVSSNYITDCAFSGIFLFSSLGNDLFENNLENCDTGIELWYSSSNRITENNLSNSDWGFYLRDSSDSRIYHNDFLNNSCQVYSENSVNVWDNGYASGGNYWSDYNGTDVFKGPYQNETGSDGIGDTPYTIDGSNTDRYPLIHLFVPLLGDLNQDGTVDIFDATQAAACFGSEAGDSKWSQRADLNKDNVIDIFDLIILAQSFGKVYHP